MRVPLDLDDPEPGGIPEHGSDQAYRYITNRHGTVTPLLHVDMSVKSFEFKDVYRRKWHKTYNENPKIWVP